MLIPRFVKGDLIQISDEHGKTECKGKQAIVLYDDTAYSNENETKVKYGLLVREYGTHQAWFDGELLSLIEPRRIDLLESFQLQRDENYKKGSKAVDDSNYMFMVSLAVEATNEGVTIENLSESIDKKLIDHLIGDKPHTMMSFDTDGDE